MRKIKMRINKNDEAVCSICKNEAHQSIMMFDLMLGKDNQLTICDVCNALLFRKTLSADCRVNEKLKTKEDIAILNKRKMEKKIETSACSINEALEGVNTV